MTTHVKADPIDELRHEHQVALQCLEEVTVLLNAADPTNASSWSQRLDEACSYLKRDVALHFKKEEEALFPAMTSYIGQGGPIAVMLREHQEHYEMLDRLCTAVGQRDLAAVRSLWESFCPHLQMHIQKEDMILFPMADRMFNADEKMQVAKIMESLGRPASTQ